MVRPADLASPSRSRVRRGDVSGWPAGRGTGTGTQRGAPVAARRRRARGRLRCLRLRAPRPRCGVRPRRGLDGGGAGRRRGARRRLLDHGCERRGVEPLLADATSVLSVPNTGHDWGAYHAGLGFVLDRCAPRSIVLMNDSVYVIPDRLEAFLERVARSPYDVVGATDSLMFRYHLRVVLRAPRPRRAGEPAAAGVPLTTSACPTSTTSSTATRSASRSGRSSTGSPYAPPTLSRSS